MKKKIMPRNEELLDIIYGSDFIGPEEEPVPGEKPKPKKPSRPKVDLKLYSEDEMPFIRKPLISPKLTQTKGLISPRTEPKQTKVLISSQTAGDKARPLLTPPGSPKQPLPKPRKMKKDAQYTFKDGDETYYEETTPFEEDEEPIEPPVTNVFDVNVKALVTPPNSPRKVPGVQQSKERLVIPLTSSRIQQPKERLASPLPSSRGSRDAAKSSRDRPYNTSHSSSPSKSRSSSSRSSRDNSRVSYKSHDSRDSRGKYTSSRDVPKSEHPKDRPYKTSRDHRESQRDYKASDGGRRGDYKGSKVYDDHNRHGHQGPTRDYGSKSSHMGSRGGKTTYQDHKHKGDHKGSKDRGYDKGRHRDRRQVGGPEMDTKKRTEQVDEVAHHIEGLRKKDTCLKNFERHSFAFVKCGVEHYNKLYDEEDFFVNIPVKPSADAKGYELFDDIMSEYLKRIAKRR